MRRVGNVQGVLVGNDLQVGYFSVRRRPNAKALPAVTALYQKMCELEDVPDAREGMRLSSEFLVAQLAHNKTDYDQFILSLEAL